MPNMIAESKIDHMGTKMAEEVGKKLYKEMKADPNLREHFSFKEDNRMDNSGDLYTTVLAKAIYYKSYDEFKQYFDLVWNLTPADIGMPEGAGAYKLPKILGAQAVKLSSGEIVDYVNDNKDSVTLETETYGIGTRINRRLIKRGAKGFIAKLMTAASDAVLRAVATDLINGLVAGADATNTVTGGISYDAIEDAKKNVRGSKDKNGILFGFEPKTMAFSNVGWNTLAKSTDFKTLVQYGQRNVPGEKAVMDYQVFNGLKVVMTPLISVQKGGKDVHALVIDTDNYGAFLRETEMETYDGRIPGTAGDKEIIHAMDAGMIVLNAEACAVVIAA